jgi:hypothetical protein
MLDRNIELPGIAVFDGGPGIAPGESWRIRDMDMFKDVPALKLLKLAGGALAALPSSEHLWQRLLAHDVFRRPQPQRQANDSTEREEQIVGVENAGNENAEEEDAVGEKAEEKSAGPDSHVERPAARIVAGELVLRVHRDLTDPVVTQSHPIIWAILRPVTPMLQFIATNIVGDDIDQQGYAWEHGLVYRGKPEIPGSWPEEDETNESLYRNMVRPGWYSQDVFLMRAMIVLACGLTINTSFMDWLGFLRSQ